ncbi:MAG: glycoside hydrolase family 43 protein [Acidimicrobiales bacterium]
MLIRRPRSRRSMVVISLATLVAGMIAAGMASIGRDQPVRPGLTIGSARQPWWDGVLPAPASTIAVPTADLPASDANAGSTAGVRPVRPPASAGLDPAKSPPKRPNRSGAGVAPAAKVESSAAVHPADFPDPSITVHAGRYWAFGTQAADRQVQVLSSTDLRTWRLEPDALPRLPVWAEWGWVWAPSVLVRPASFVLFYTTRHAATGLQCISHATSVVVGGPYVDGSTEPLVCQMDRGGSIDPEPFVAGDGSTWLLWKSEGTIGGEPTRLWAQALAHDGQQLVGARSELLATAAPWEEPIIEGPAMVEVDGRFHLLYSANRWETAAYAIGHAVCSTPLGPCRRTGRGPVLSAGESEAGPGSPAPFRTLTGELVVGYHAWPAGAVSYPAGARRLHLGQASVQGDTFTIARGWLQRTTALG